jgi:hypothetical protein
MNQIEPEAKSYIAASMETQFADQDDLETPSRLLPKWVDRNERQNIPVWTPIHFIQGRNDCSTPFCASAVDLLPIGDVSGAFGLRR